MAINSSKSSSYYIVRILLALVFGVTVFFITTIVLTNAKKYCANSVTCIKDLTTRVENNTVGVFEGHKVSPPKIDLSQPIPSVVPEKGEKHVYVDLSTQTLYAYQGDTLFMKTFISSGKWHPTPTGDFHIWVKLRSTRMAGGSGEDAYDLPNVPYTMYFYNDDVPKESGFSLHGAYWHDNFGHPMSHGCVNMRIIDAEKLYAWVDPPTTSNTTYATDSQPGTLVSICSHINMQGNIRECVQ